MTRRRQNYSASLAASPSSSRIARDARRQRSVEIYNAEVVPARKERKAEFKLDRERAESHRPFRMAGGPSPRERLVTETAPKNRGRLMANLAMVGAFLSGRFRRQQAR